MSRNTLVTFVSLLLASSAFAGPMTPPPGAPGATMKPLSELEPRTAINSTNTPGDADSVFRISVPGSYYLSADVLVEAGKSGIEVATYGVTIDLNGFSVTALPGSQDAIVSNNSNCTMTVRNGTLLTPLGYGIRARATTLVEDVTIQGSTTSPPNGILLEGAGSVVRRCRVLEFWSFGIGISAPDAVIEDCLITATVDKVNGTNWGIVGWDSRATVRDCTIRVIGGIGPIQMNAEGSLIERCITNGSGITLFGPTVVRENVIIGPFDASGVGLYSVSGGSLFEGNTIRGFDKGIQGYKTTTHGPDVIVRNRIYKCATGINANGADVGPIGTAATATSPNANIVNN